MLGELRGLGHGEPAPATAERAASRARMKALQSASDHYKAGDLDSFHETLAVSSFQNSRVSVALADPNLPDCPLVGLSHGFQILTGYSRSEIIGKNCRMLSRGCPINAQQRHELRLACQLHTRFVGVLINRRKNGEVFQNLLHMSSIMVGRRRYIVGVQADVTHLEYDLAEAHINELQQIVDAIFAANVNAWAAVQIRSFDKAVLTYAERVLLPRCNYELYQEARDAFVSLAPVDAQTHDRLRYSNTFLSVCCEEEERGEMRLRRVASMPELSTTQEVDLLPLAVFKESLDYMSALPGKDRQLELVEDSELAVRSMGSSEHPHRCTPCSFHCYSYAGCSRGELCPFCHMDHPRRVRRRGRAPKKIKSLECKDNNLDEPAPLEDGVEALDANEGCSRASMLPATVQAVAESKLRHLLSALSVLSPLPLISVSEIPSEERVLRYSESDIVFIPNHWKQVLPFIHGLDGPLTFVVHPPLQPGLGINRHTGVICGCVNYSTDPAGSYHEVTAFGQQGSATALLHIVSQN